MPRDPYQQLSLYIARGGHIPSSNQCQVGITEFFYNGTTIPEVHIYIIK